MTRTRHHGKRQLTIAAVAQHEDLHIALREAGLDFDLVKVDIPTRKTRAGDDFTTIKPNGYVPALVLDDGSLLTENVALLDWLAQRTQALMPPTDRARTRQIEMLAFLSTEVQKPFVRLFFSTQSEEQAWLRESLAGRLDWLAPRVDVGYLLGSSFGVADALLYVMLRWADMVELAVPAPLARYKTQIEQWPAVRAALKVEGLS
ncbi:MAG: glutathione S-transferase N-terminal domain-containing protein [Panacagrimonas sp.]